MVHREHLIAVVGAFLIGCAVLLFVGCAGMRSAAPQKEEQARSDRCEGTRTFKKKWWRGDRFPENLGVYTTNDVPGCPKGGLLTGTDKNDRLDGKEGDDEIHGLGGVDNLFGGRGNDIIYDGPGDADIWLLGDDGDDVLYGGDGNEDLYGGGGDDVLYGGDGNEWLFGEEGEDVVHGGDGHDWVDGAGDGRQRDKLYCGEGEDHYTADKLDYVDSSCEVKGPPSNL